MGGSPKRGRMAAGCMSRGRLILLAVLAIQLLLVVCLMKAPRLIFLGTSSRASDLADPAEEAASASWLWHRFVVENAKADHGAKAVVLANCTDGDGRVVLRGSSIECEHRKVNATVNESDHGRLRRPGGIEVRNGSAVDELRAARLSDLDRRLPARNGSVESGVLRQRRGRVETRRPARDGSTVDDLRAARERRFGERLAAAPVDRNAARAERISSQLRGSIGDSLERDSFRFRGRGGYGDRLRGDVKEQAREARASVAPAAMIRVPSADPLDDVAEDDLSEDPDVAVPRSEATYVGRRASFGPLPSINATARSNLTSLEVLRKNSTQLEKLEKSANATAPSALFGAHNASGVNATLTSQSGGRNATLRDAFSANASSINGTLIELFGAQNASLGDSLMANVSDVNATLAAQFGALNVSLGDAIAANVSGINATLGELFGALNVSLAVNVSGVNATLGELFGALNVSLAANVTGVNATLGELFGALNMSLGDAIAANVSGVNATLSELFGALNVSGINATLGELFGALNVSLGDAIAANVSGVNATIGELLGAHNASLAANASSSTNATLDAQLGARNAVKANLSETCARGLIYVYTLPKKFNKELLENCSSLLQWGDRCRELSNAGLGPSLDESPLRHSQKQGTNGSGGPWYGTDQFNGEVIFHERMLAHRCRTRNPELARAFYVPYYGGLDVARFLFNVSDKKFTAADRDKLGGGLVEWLAQSPYWKRHHGADHFLMLGRITWDFRRKGSHGWGSSLINMPAMANVTKLALERSPWDNTEMAIPYPTAFHPRDDSEVVHWQTSLRKTKRDLLFSFAGAPRREFPNDFRIDLFEQCKQAKSCALLDCSERKCEDDSLVATRLFTRSTFCLQPRGDSFTRRSIFDSLVAGCIPVFFWTKSAYLQYYWHLPAEYSSYSVFIPKDDIRSGTKIEQILLKISPAKVQQMQETILAMIPRLVYAGPEHELVKFKDAFDTTIDQVMINFDQLRVNHTSVIKQALGPIEETVVTART